MHWIVPLLGVGVLLGGAIATQELESREGKFPIFQSSYFPDGVCRLIEVIIAIDILLANKAESFCTSFLGLEPSTTTVITLSTTVTDTIKSETDTVTSYSTTITDIDVPETETTTVPSTVSTTLTDSFTTTVTSTYYCKH
jgi:hypothetical protein